MLGKRFRRVCLSLNGPKEAQGKEDNVNISHSNAYEKTFTNTLDINRTMGCYDQKLDSVFLNMKNDLDEISDENLLDLSLKIEKEIALNAKILQKPKFGFCDAISISSQEDQPNPMKFQKSIKKAITDIKTKKELQNCTPTTPRKLRKLPANFSQDTPKPSKVKRKVKTETKEDKNPNLLPELKTNASQTPETTRQIRKRKVKTEIKRVKNEILKNLETFDEPKTEQKVRRKLTKSTDLKKYSYKDHPPSQKKIENYFIKTPKKNTVGYFETFEKSSVKTNTLPMVSLPIENLNACLGVLQEEAKIKTSKNKLIEGSIIKSEENLTISQENIVEYRINDNADIIGRNTSYDIYKQDKQDIEEFNVDQPIHSGNITADIKKQSSRINQKTSVAIENLQKRKKSIQSSASYSLSETAQAYKDTSVRRSLESKFTEESEKIKLPSLLKKFRKRLSFKCSSSDQISDVGSEQSVYFNPLPITSDISEIYYNIDLLAESTNGKEIENKNISLEEDSIIVISDDDDSNKLAKTNNPKHIQNICTASENYNKAKQKRKFVECPTYKVVDGTTFAVDAFRFGVIEDVTHYFLTHFHGDHYIGLKKSFSKPMYMSSITAKLVESFIHVNPEHITVINPNESVIINEIEVTAIDANHCPGAVMFAFKLPNGNVTLHTGDFRASFEMESNPYFWNNEIHTVYLDTTYLNKKYDFKSQSESIDDVRECIANFQKKHIGQKILYVCGSYVIGKEKVWAAIAELTNELVYTKGNRYKALQCIDDLELKKYLNNDPKVAGIHVLTMGELYYDKLYEYWKLHEEDYDLLLAIRPSGWERNSKPQYRGKINIVGIEYSEHSSCSELRRFIRFLQPKNIISTVPFGSDLSKTCKIPINWFDNQLKPKQNGYQPTITNFTSSKKKCKKIKNLERTPTKEPTGSYKSESFYDVFVSPLKSKAQSPEKLKC